MTRENVFHDDEPMDLRTARGPTAADPATSGEAGFRAIVLDSPPFQCNRIGVRTHVLSSCWTRAFRSPAYLSRNPWQVTMRLANTLVVLLLFASAVCAAQTPTQPPTLEERMSAAEKHAAGLDKLTPDELRYLDAWLQSHGGLPPPPTGPYSATQRFYPDDSARQTIDSRIAGDFTGWRGKTEFTLDNGQKWVQAESGSFDTGVIHNPAVKIKPMILGSWLMYVDGCGCSVRVQRIE